jgi:hypothetical protein
MVGSVRRPEAGEKTRGLAEVLVRLVPEAPVVAEDAREVGPVDRGRGKGERARGEVREVPRGRFVDLELRQEEVLGRQREPGTETSFERNVVVEAQDVVEDVDLELGMEVDVPVAAEERVRLPVLGEPQLADQQAVDLPGVALEPREVEVFEARSERAPSVSVEVELAPGSGDRSRRRRTRAAARPAPPPPG